MKDKHEDYQLHHIAKMIEQASERGDKQHRIELAKINELEHQLKHIAMKQSELAEQLTTITGQVAKIGTESAATLQKVADLEAALANQDNVTPEVQAAFDALKAQVTVVDDLVPDAPAPTPESGL